MSWALTIVGIAGLIVIHEGGHALAAHWMGMRVERFALFFPPLIAKRRIGATEFAIGSIPLGGYVKITGQSQADAVPERDVSVSYAAKPIWRRAVVIASGPAANLLACLILVTMLLLVQGRQEVVPSVSAGALSAPAAGTLRPGDRIVSVDGRGGAPASLVAATRAHRCVGKAIARCEASKPATVVLEREGRRLTWIVRPIWDAKVGAMRLGFSFEVQRHSIGPVAAARAAVTSSWAVAESTVRAVTGITDSRQREQLGGIVGGVAVTQSAFSTSLGDALELLAFISLSIAIVNLFPLLPLDGGHLLWLLVEKLRGRPASQETLERAAVVGFALVAVLFFVGLSNDVGRLAAGGFSAPR